MSPSCGRMTISSTVAPSEVSYAEKIDFATSSTFIKRSSGKDVPSQLPVRVAPGKTAVTFIFNFLNSSLRH